jgi:hypothetical protein
MRINETFYPFLEIPLCQRGTLTPPFYKGGAGGFTGFMGGRPGH